MRAARSLLATATRFTVSATARAAVFAAVLGAGLTVAAPARAVMVEYIVAVVGDRPILYTELRARARPFLLQIAAKVPPGPQQAAAESQVMKELIQTMVDEELEVQAAEKAKVSVTADEIDNALHNIAGAQGLATSDLLREAERSTGMSEVDYREEIRRQILEGKMLQLRVKGRVRVTEEDVKAMYERTLHDERKRREFQPAWIVLRLLPGSSREAIAERRALAQELVRRVRRGEPFAALAKAYSDDTPTREIGGDLGIRAPQGSPTATSAKRPTISPELDAAAQSLEEGQVTDPIEVAGGEALVIVQLVARQPSHYTKYEDHRPEMLQRLQAEILGKAKRKWLDELKGRTHLEVRF